MTSSQRGEQVGDANGDAGLQADESVDADGEQSPPPEQRVQELETQLEEVRAQHARAVADYQNLRRRAGAEQREYTRLAQTASVINYLPVHDDLRRALDTVSEHEEIAEHQWVEGIHIVLRKLWGALEASGVEEIEADGRPFDPRLHEAVSSAAGPAGQVVAVVQTGYVLDGQVVRPAMVLVGNGDAEAGGDGPGEQTPDGHAADQQTKNDANDDARDGGER